MELEIRNTIRIRNPDAELREYLKELLTNINPEWLDAINFGRWAKNIPRDIVQYQEDGSDLIVPRGMLHHLLVEVGREWQSIDDLRVRPEIEQPWPTPNARLRPDDQEPAVRSLLRYENGFLSAPAGSGKTVMGLEIARRLGLKTLWLTHQQVLKDQAIEEAVGLFGLNKKEVGVLQGKTWKIGPQLTVGMVPTLVKRDLSEIRDAFGTVLVDEAHHVPSKTFLNVVNEFNSHFLYGLTATAYRRDNLDPVMFNAIGPVMARIEHEELVEDEHLMIPSVYRRATGWNPPGSVNWDYSDFMDAMVESRDRNRLIVNDIVRECGNPNNTCAVLVARTRHAKIFADLLKEEGVRCEFVVGSIEEEGSGKKKVIPKEVRDTIVRDFKEGKIQVLIGTYNLLAEGFNYRPLNRLFLATPIKWKGTVVQSLGRIQRPHESKQEAIAYDYVDWDISMFARQAENRLFSVYRSMEIEVQDI